MSARGRGRKGGGGYGRDQQPTPSFGRGVGVSEFTTLRIERCTPPSIQHNPALSVLALSDETEQQQPPPVSSKGTRSPERLGFRTVGRKVIVKENHFLVQVADRDLAHYDARICLSL
ncbi:unnamed protein product [Fraxinus pennsylvanica]|uniref:Uncharacterized protein n=1 Tax=Fraxinus pennsylvanica TaxID=56036 RepID=A0AAD2A2T7_9LAMI|nr:unnamed protein product [Fraxinus pennsylvanica]